MKLFTVTLFWYFLGTCIALYPSANYESVVTKGITIPTFKYNVPIKADEIYGLPHFKVPSIIYGVLSKTFDFDLADLLVGDNDKEEVLQKPTELYEIPSTSYGVPVQKNLVPKNVLIQKPPIVLSNSYDGLVEKIPTLHKVDFSVDVLSQRPPISEISYGLPLEPVQTYGIPSLHTVDFVVKPPVSLEGVVVPKTPAEDYGVPLLSKVDIPNVKYRVPDVQAFVVSKDFESYELPKVHVSEIKSGLLHIQSNVKIPATVYGVPF